MLGLGYSGTILAGVGVINTIAGSIMISRKDQISDFFNNIDRNYQAYAIIQDGSTALLSIGIISMIMSIPIMIFGYAMHKKYKEIRKENLSSWENYYQKTSRKGLIAGILGSILIGTGCTIWGLAAIFAIFRDIFSFLSFAILGSLSLTAGVVLSVIGFSVYNAFKDRVKIDITSTNNILNMALVFKF